MADMGDIEDIQRVKYRYLRALDTKHWDEFADTLTEDVIGDYGESLGEEHHFTDRATLVEFMRNVDARRGHHRAPGHAPRDRRRR